MGEAEYCAAVETAVSTSSRATSSRLSSRSASISISMRRPSISTGSCVRSTRARTCTSCGMATSKSSAVHRSRWCSCSITGSLAARSPAPASAANRGTRPPAGRRAHRAPQGNRRARHARRPCPQRCRPRGRVRLAPDRRDDDAGEVQPRYAPHVAGERRSPKAVRRSTCCAPPFPPARSRELRRCGRWRSSTNSNR